MKRKFALYYLVCFTLFAVITPNLQLLLKELGWDLFQIGLLQGVYQLVGVSGPLLVGVLADRTGRYRSLIFAGYLTLLPLFFLLGRISSLPLAMVSIGLIGISLKSIVPLSDALLSKNLKDPQEDYGKLRIWGSVGFLACTLVLDYGGLLQGDFIKSFNTLILITVGFTVLTLLLLPSQGRPSEHHRDRSDGQKIPGIYWGLMAILFVAWFAKSAYFSFYSLFLRENTEIAMINLQWGLGALFEIPLMFLSGPLIRRRGLKGLLIFTLVFLIIRLMIYAFFKDPLVLTMSQLLHSITFGLLHSISIAVVNRFVPREKLAQAMSFYSAIIRGGSAFLGSTLGGWISKGWGLESLYFIYAFIPIPLIIILCFIPSHKLNWKRRGDDHETLDLDGANADSSGSLPAGESQ